MEIYHRLGEASHFEDVDHIYQEMQDRFGAVPQAALWLCILTKIRLYAAAKAITWIKMEKLTMTFDRQKGNNTIKKIVTLPSTKKPEEFLAKLLPLLE
jgi:transcription-repair coupling factor (superfamily II helicase)